MKSQSAFFERLGLFVVTVLLPLEENLPTIGGRTITSIMLLFLAVYTFIFRRNDLLYMIRRPVFIAAYIFLIVGSLVELSHPNADYFILSRIGQMFLAGICIAALCRDKAAIMAVIYGFILGGIYLSIILILGVYIDMKGFIASDFNEASTIRTELFEDFSLKENLNRMSYLASLGFLLSTVLCLSAKLIWQKRLFLVSAILCIIGTFLPMSRGGIAITIIVLMILVFTHKIKLKRAILGILIILSIGVIFVPKAIFPRMHFDITSDKEGRARVYRAAVTHMPEYIVRGVGAGNFWTSWGFTSEYVYSRAGSYSIMGAHNCFIQVAIYWGLPGLASFLIFIFLASRCLPPQDDQDMVSIAIFTSAVSLFLLMMISHRIYAKELAICIGLLVGAHYWIFQKQK